MPVIVIGNITVGGTGKTPFVIWLANKLAADGWRPGIVSRGYGGRADSYPLVVDATTSWRQAGDEAPMIVRRTGCPMVVAPDRVAAAQHLLAHFDCDILLSDDGLQHYALARTLEFAMVDGARGLGNGRCLPAGPLREPSERIATVDAVICTGQCTGLREDELVMQLRPTRLLHLFDGEQCSPQWLQGKAVHAFAGIGHPQRFFALLRALGAVVAEHAMADHQALAVGDFQLGPNAIVVMTEKDAMRCTALEAQELPKSIWYLEVAACFERADVTRLDALLSARLAMPLQATQTQEVQERATQAQA